MESNAGYVLLVYLLVFGGIGGFMLWLWRANRRLEAQRDELRQRNGG